MFDWCTDMIEKTLSIKSSFMEVIVDTGEGAMEMHDRPVRTTEAVQSTDDDDEPVLVRWSKLEELIDRLGGLVTGSGGLEEDWNN